MASRNNRKKLTVGFTYNQIPPDCSKKEREHYLKYGEWDSPTTINAVVSALEKAGSRVMPIEAYRHNGYDIYRELDRLGPEIDIVFNIAEGFGTRNRESIVPAMLEWMHIPCTGSDAGALAINLNKADTIEILRNYGINIAPFYVFKSNDITDVERFTSRLKKVFPLIVKPVGEGTSVGMTQDSVVESVDQLKKAIEQIIVEYNQPAMAQQFLDGDEYTVGILGDLVLPILKLNLKELPKSPRIRDSDVKEIDIDYCQPARFNENYVLLAAQAAIAQAALSCRDYNRMDFKKHNDGKIYFLETNPLPGLNPESSDFPKMCRLAGISHDVMINAVLFEAVKRYQADKEFSDRFDGKRVAYIREFIEPTMKSLGTYHVAVPPETSDNVYYRLVKPVHQK